MKLKITILALFVSLCSCRSVSTTKHFNRPVRLYEVELLGGVSKSFAATFTSSQSTTLAFRHGGDIDNLAVSSGDVVVKGQFIASISPEIFIAEKEAARAQFLMAQSNFERYKRLREINAVSAQQSEAAYANFISAQSRYNNATTALEQTKLFAPLSGIIEQTFVDNFEPVQPFQKVASLINPDSLEVDFTIAPSDLKLLTLANVRYSIRTENTPPRRIKGTLKSYVDVVSGGEGYDVTVAIDQKGFSAKKYNIRPGNSCSVVMDVENPLQDSLFGVPISAIYTTQLNSDKWVWLYNSATSTVSLQRVELGELYGDDMVVVSGGLSLGAMVVSGGIYSLVENQKVSEERR